MSTLGWPATPLAVGNDLGLRVARAPEKPGRLSGDQPVQVPPTDSPADRSASSQGPVFFGDYQLFES